VITNYEVLLNLQTKYLIGIVAITSILLASFAGFSLAYFWYQPQIDSMTRNLQELNSTVANLTHNISDLKVNYTALQSRIASLNASLSQLINYVHSISLVSGSSYYIFKQNNTYYTQNGHNGTIEYQDENCTSVIEYALTHISPGGEVLLKPLASDTDAYYIDNTIYPPNCTTLASENRMVTICLKNNSNNDVIDLYNVSYVQIRNIRICGNRWNNTNGNGVVIGGRYGGSNHLIENVVIEDCNGTGIWVQNSQLNNAFRNVQVFRSGAYNIRVDSADNQFIDVQSDSAGLSGFYVSNVDNYFLNCISWGCGTREDQIDCNGFSIAGARNLFIGCDGDRNDRGGFVLAGANQTMLASCIGRNNGRRVSGSWGFDLYNSIGTVMSACVATDEQPSKTQDYAFTEGGNSDYNIVTGCNFDGNRVGAVFALVGMHSVITQTVGYETQSFSYSNFRYLGAPIAVGVNDVYGDPTNFTSSKRTIVDFHVTIKWDNVSGNENVTVRVQALMANGTATSFEISRNVAGTYILNEDDISGLWSSWSIDNPIVELQLSAKTTENATGAAVSVYVWGSGN
jgi:outer membrane murein-binding lipoprotein Lpp